MSVLNVAFYIYEIDLPGHGAEAIRQVAKAIDVAPSYGSEEVKLAEALWIVKDLSESFPLYEKVEA